MKTQTKQVNLRIKTGLLARLKQESKKAGITRTEFIVRLLAQFFNEQDIKKSIEARKAQEV
jgi:predicted DNA binding CopG/RHH family protein